MNKTNKYYYDLLRIATRTLDANCDICTNAFSDISETKNLLSRVSKKLTTSIKDIKFDMNIKVGKQETNKNRYDILIMMEKILGFRKNL